MTRIGYALLVAAGLAIALGGCPSMSTLQTTRTVPQGETRFALGLEGVGITGSGGSATLPQTEFGVRYGVSDDVDIGGKFYLLGAEAGAKFMLMRGSLDAAVAPAVSYFSWSAENDSGDNASVSLIYMHLPVLFGSNLSDTTTLGFGPKFLYILAFGDSTTDSGDDFNSASGLMGGGYLQLAFRLGRAFWLAPEVNVYTPLSDDPFSGALWQGGIGLFFGGAEPDQGAAAPGAIPPAPSGY